MLVRKINALIWFYCIKKKMTNFIEDKRKDKAHTHWNPKRHIPLVSLLFWHKMVAMHYFIWPPALRLWSGRQAAKQTVGLSLLCSKICLLVFLNFSKILHNYYTCFYAFQKYIMLFILCVFLSAEFYDTVQLTGNVACTRMMRVTCARVTRVDAARLQ